MSETLGLIGCGNMGGAIFKGVASHPKLRGRFKLVAHSRTMGRCRMPGVELADSPSELAAKSRIMLLAVKPPQIVPMLEAIGPSLQESQVVVSVAAGVAMDDLRAAVNGRCAVARVMPNTPASVGQGIFGLCLDDPALREDDAAVLRGLFEALGQVIQLPEDKMNALSAVAGCGPAYVFHFVDAVIESAVTLGFTRDEARAMVLQLFKGSLVLAEESGEHPAVLRERVCSPGGMTIAAMNHLDRTAVRGHIVDAVLAAYEKGKK